MVPYERIFSKRIDGSNDYRSLYLFSYHGNIVIIIITIIIIISIIIISVIIIVIDVITIFMIILKFSNMKCIL